MAQSVTQFSLRLAQIAGVAAIIGLTACGPGPAPQGINDPFEKENRSTHQLNLALDKNVIRPIARSTTKIIPKPVVQGVSNFAGNLDLPGEVINDVLQLRLGKAAHNTLRFAINTTIGIGGLFDPATPMGAPEKPTDFGETLAVWGVGEGEYLELPLYGPSTRRDALGKVVDIGINPVRLFIPKDKLWINTFSQVFAKIGDRGRYSETYDSILYESADSYAQARLLYLEHRRHDLGQVTTDSDFEDPYAQ
jgi:phospholipid-binding lipoprotein MlaA